MLRSCVDGAMRLGDDINSEALCFFRGLAHVSRMDRGLTWRSEKAEQEMANQIHVEFFLQN